MSNAAAKRFGVRFQSVRCEKFGKFLLRDMIPKCRMGGCGRCRSHRFIWVNALDDRCIEDLLQ